MGSGTTPGLPSVVSATLASSLPQAVERFYAALGERPGPGEVLARLSPAERRHLQVRQCEHVLALLGADAGLAARRAASREVGRIHAEVGVEMDWFVEALVDLLQTILRLLEPHAAELDHAAAQALVTERFMGDLHAVVSGYRDVDQAESAVLLAVTRAVGDAETVADLSQGVLDHLAALPGVVACFLARPDDDGCLQFEVGAGQAADAFLAAGDPATRITTDQGSPSGVGPSGRAWRTGEIQRCDAYLHDPSTRTWRGLGERFGFRSSVAVPLVDGVGTPRALLSLYGSRVGCFAPAQRQATLLQVKQVFERKLVELEERPTAASGVTAYRERTTHLARLRAGDVEMVFQPVVDLRDGSVAKFEALARLVVADGRLAPAVFLPSFGHEELYRLFELGLDQSLLALVEWRRSGCRAGVSLNLPVGATADARYLTATAAALERHGVEPGELTLELLETGAIEEELVVARRLLDAFKALGVRLSQDDLGAGYSSLLRLRHVDFDEVKIDRELVTASQAPSRTLLQFLQPITEIAHNLGMSVTAEGLETEGLVDAAVQLGVDAGQGFAIAPPLRRQQLATWVEGFRLGARRGAPATPLGALAGHTAWERRAVVLHDEVAHPDAWDIERCDMTAYLRSGHDQAVASAHARLHAAARLHRGGHEHREAWLQIVASLGLS